MAIKSDHEDNLKKSRLGETKQNPLDNGKHSNKKDTYERIHTSKKADA
jgi:hypothetical protein